MQPFAGPPGSTVKKWQVLNGLALPSGSPQLFCELVFLFLQRSLALSSVLHSLPNWELVASSPELCAKQVCEVCKGQMCETHSDPCLPNEELLSTRGAVSSVLPFTTVFARPPFPSGPEA